MIEQSLTDEDIAIGIALIPGYVAAHGCVIGASLSEMKFLFTKPYTTAPGVRYGVTNSFMKF
jgi:hypothetical protein